MLNESLILTFFFFPSYLVGIAIVIFIICPFFQAFIHVVSCVTFLFIKKVHVTVLCSTITHMCSVSAFFYFHAPVTFAETM